ncbi:hypothetical protein AB4072_00755 [Microvirga sp. 2MCAF38]|uniref:hypothetical protein n=1 Tax=Microvirga sp. 2MCAF38 TaxID=3232989 RepID=UPI003F999446
MLRTLLALALAVSSVSTSYAAECTPSLHKRWEEAMIEVAQIHRILLHSKSVDPDTKTLCRIVKSVSDISEVGNEYFPACDPLSASHGRVLILRINEVLAKTDISPCSKPVGKTK